MGYGSRYVNPRDIRLPGGYAAQVFARGLTAPGSIAFDGDGVMYITDSGITDGNGKLLRHCSGGFQVTADGFNPPVTGITYYEGSVYVAHKGSITSISKDGSRKDIIRGLPSFGDHANSGAAFSSYGKMYFGQGTATNSGIVGTDNRKWLMKYPFFHDLPGEKIRLNGHNFETENIMSAAWDEKISTGAFLPFGTASSAGEIVSGALKASGSILYCGLDGSGLKQAAWGLRNPCCLRFDDKNRLFCTNRGMTLAGSRPVAASPDEFLLIKHGYWYGWPDFTGGLPVTAPQYKPKGMDRPKFLLAEHPMTPPFPYALFEPGSGAAGFDFSPDSAFGRGDAYIAEFGNDANTRTGRKISRLDMRTRTLTSFAYNKTAGRYSGGFARPSDVKFGNDKAMYVADYGLFGSGGELIPDTGVIWRIYKFCTYRLARPRT